MPFPRRTYPVTVAHMVEMTQSELAAVVAGLATRKFVNKTVYGCECGGTHGLACPARA